MGIREGYLVRVTIRLIARSATMKTAVVFLCLFLAVAHGRWILQEGAALEDAPAPGKVAPVPAAVEDENVVNKVLKDDGDDDEDDNDDDSKRKDDGDDDGDDDDEDDSKRKDDGDDDEDDDDDNSKRKDDGDDDGDDDDDEDDSKRKDDG